MKPISLVLLAVLAAPLFVSAQDAPSAVPIESAAVSGTLSNPPVSALPPAPFTARIPGTIPDGTPPPPTPPKPRFIVPTKDILATSAHRQGGRTITIQKIKPIPLPPPPPPEPAPPMVSGASASQDLIEESQVKRSGDGFIFVSASVFRFKDSSVRSLVNIQPIGGGDSVTFWSSADFGYLSGFMTFIGSDNEPRNLIMGWGAEDFDSMDDLQGEFARAQNPQAIPRLPAGKATFVITSGRPTDEALVTIQSLHDLYNNEFSRLKAAYEGRERARLQREADLKANPPKPKDLVINFWRTEKPAPAKGGDK